MSSRRARAAAARGEPVPPEQMDGYAFNVFGWAMQIPADEPAFAGRATIINAYEPSGTPWEKGIAAMLKKGEDPWRKSLSLTARESDDSEEAGVQRYLLVGITCTDLEATTHFKKHKSQGKQKPVGTHLDPGSIVSIARKERLPIMSCLHWSWRAQSQDKSGELSLDSLL